MLLCLIHSLKLQWNLIIILPLITLSSVRCSDIRTQNYTQHDSLHSGTRKRVEKILNFPVTLSFGEESTTRGVYASLSRNDERNDEKIDDGQFGKRIILGIIENSDEPITQLPDQKISQTIVKFFDQEDYDGIKTNPIVVGDPYEDDANQNEKTFKQEQSFATNNEEKFQGDEKYTDVYKDKEKIIEVEDTERVIQNDLKKKSDHQSEEYNEEYEDTEILSTHVKKNDTLGQKYRENIPANHKETYTDVEYPDNYPQTHNEEPPAILLKEPPLKTSNGSSKYYNRESAKSSDMKDNVFREDQKGTADNSQENLKKNRNEKYASGKGQEQHEEHHERKEDKGIKNYKGFHEESKKKKGHQDEEKHGKKYADKGGEEKKHHEEHEHHGDYNKGEKGEKGYEFSEEGKHNKGHSTKGEHNIHKKDEYEKKQEFFDEHHEGGEHEGHGGFHHEEHYKKGGHKKVGHNKKGNNVDHYGKKSHHEKGHFYDDKGGKKKAFAHNKDHSHNSKHGKKVGTSGGKNWGYKKQNNGYKIPKEVEHAAQTNSLKIRKAPLNISDKYNEKNKYPHYIAKIHIHNDNRRSDQIDDKDETNQEMNDNKEEVAEIFDSELSGNDSDDAQIENKEIKNQHSGEISSDQNEGSKQHGTENIESDHLLESSILHEQNANSDKISSSKLLPKIYVILPEDFEEQLQRSAENSESSSNEKDSFNNDSEEEGNSPKIQTIQRIYTKTLEPQSFSEEHKKRISEIGYIIHKIGSELGKNMENSNSQSKMGNKPPRDQF
ncbi:nuclear speckle splicing regulatory protein 1-like [Harmonia axyridis]|uniref:nuclear speckle splicing regulatory protein 1-like n=1 Tax=Harmonia axyridis TaxID=115357 RepID=UPI001E2782B6|nr:nuclear speckle splicing regulatory protein 1-like [Harmonia axyridis]